MQTKQPRIAILSLRKKNDFVYNSCLYEFEDLIAEVDDVDIIEIAAVNTIEDFSYRLVKKSAGYIAPITQVKPPLNPTIDLEQEYDILFFIVDFPHSILHINLINHWRQKSKIAVCYVIELWKTELKKFNNYLKFLKNFDYIFLGHSQIVEQVQKITNKPCAYLAPACDTLKFRPHSPNSIRAIDMCSMGRRSNVTHQKLLDLARKKQFFYHYDPLGGSELHISNHQDHRTLNANILKNSRYFIAHHAKINVLEQTGDQIEIGYRFFEGAAAGTIMLGTAPNNEVFEEYFGWENAVIPMPFDEPNIEAIITELDCQPEFLQGISNRNVQNSLLKHDWVYRWQQVLDTAGISATDKLEARKNLLEQLANTFTPTIA